MSNVIDITARIKELKLMNMLKDLAEKEWDQMAKHGFYAHHVFPGPDDTGYPANWASHHTHGLELATGHMNFEIQLNIDPQLAVQLFADIANRIVVDGEKFEPGVSSRVIKDMNVLLKKTVCSAGNDVLRIILPDPSGNLDRNTMDESYLVQFLEDYS
jgi:hypothetical protein